MRYLSILLAVPLAGCVGGQIDWTGEKTAQAEYAAIQAREDATCQSYGATPGSLVYIQCRMNLSNQRAAMTENNRVMATQYLLNRR